MSTDFKLDDLVTITITGARLVGIWPSEHERALLTVQHEGVTYKLTGASVVSILPVDAVECPRCRQLLVPDADGRLPLHEIHPGGRRSPYCPRSGKSVTGDAAPGALAQLVLDRALPGGAS